MKYYKVYVKDEETNIKVQKGVLANGFRWSNGTGVPINTSALFLYLEEGKMVYSSIDTFKYFREYEAIELTPEEFMRLTPEDLKEDRVFDIEPDELVLVRDHKDEMWLLNRYSNLSDFGFRAYGDYCHIARYKGNEEYRETNEDIPDLWNINEVV